MDFKFSKIRVLETGLNPAQFNMALDEALMDSASDDLPILRTYGWKPQAISIGYFQSIHEEVDLEKCRQLGIDVVRRMTGGGAVLHDSELTYSFITRKYPQNIMESYNWICNAVTMSINKLGFNAEFVPLNDIIINGKKVSGNAQTRKNGVLLQHGTILLNVNVEKMFSVLKVPSEKLRNKAIKDVKERVTGLDNITFDEMAVSLKDAFSEALGAKPFIDNVTEQELQYVKRLSESKYSQQEWNFKR